MNVIRCLYLIVLLVALLILGACSSGKISDSSQAKGSDNNAEIELDLSHFYPPTHFVEDVVQEFIAEIDKRTDGRIKITSYSGSSLVEPDEHFDAAAMGSVDIAISVHGYTPGEFPLSSVLELPFLANNSIEGSAIFWKLYNEFDEFKDEYDGTVPLWLYTTDPGHIHTVDKPIESLDDLKGKRIRSPSAEASQWLEALGATPVSMPMNENFEALERGVVDGTIGSWEAVIAWGLDEVINYSTEGYFYNTTNFVVMNEDTWNSLSEEDQQIFREVSDEMIKRTGEMFDEYTVKGIESATEKGVEINELTEEKLVEWREYIDPIIDDWIEINEKKGLPAREVYDRASELLGK